MYRLGSLSTAALLSAVLLYSQPAGAHCDTMNGPVVTDAKLALQKGDVTPVLKWVKPNSEADIRAAFKKTMLVRVKGPEARDLADQYFFETLVRIHRQGEGAPYTGLKTEPVESGIAAADAALEKGSVDDLIKDVNAAVAKGIQSRYRRAFEARQKASSSVEAGREYVEAYVDFIHHVEKLHQTAAGASPHEAAGAEPAGEHED